MSLILDALKKAQEERKRFVTKATANNVNKPAKSRRLLYIIIAGSSICLAIVFVLMIVLLGPKLPVQSPGTVEKNQIATVFPAMPSKAPESKITRNNEEISVNKEKTVKAGGVEIKIHEKREDKKNPLNQGPYYTSMANAKKCSSDTIAPDSEKSVHYSKNVYEKTGRNLSKKDNVRITVRQVKTDNERISVMYNEALRKAEEGNYNEARRIYSAILAERPNHIEALNNLGVIAMKDGKTKEAMFYFDRIIAYKKDYGKAYNNMGLIMMHEGDKRLAEEYFKKSMEIDRDSIEPGLNLSALFRTEKRFEEASNLLRSALQKKGGNPMLNLSYGIIKDEMNQYEDAVKYYRYYLQAGGESPERNKIIERLKYLEDEQVTKNRNHN